MAFVDDLLLLRSARSIRKAVCSSARLEKGKHSGSPAFRVLPPDEFQPAGCGRAQTQQQQGYLIRFQRNDKALHPTIG